MTLSIWRENDHTTRSTGIVTLLFCVDFIVPGWIFAEISLFIALSYGIWRPFWKTSVLKTFAASNCLPQFIFLNSMTLRSRTNHQILGSIWGIVSHVFFSCGSPTI